MKNKALIILITVALCIIGGQIFYHSGASKDRPGITHDGIAVLEAREMSEGRPGSSGSIFGKDEICFEPGIPPPGGDEGPGGHSQCGSRGPGGPGGPEGPGGPIGPGGPGGPGGKGEHGFGVSVKLTTEEMTKVETYLRETDTSKYKDLQELKNKDEQFYQKIMAEVYRDMLFLERLKKENPSLYKNIMEERTLDSACRQIIKKLKDEKDSSKSKAYKSELRKNLSRIFDLRQMSREEKIKRIESDIAKLKAKNEQRKKEKDKIVDLRLSEIIGRAEGLEW